MNYLKTGLLSVMFALVAFAGQGSSIGEGVESPISGKQTSEVNVSSRNKTTTTATTTKTTTTTTGKKPDVE